MSEFMEPEARSGLLERGAEEYRRLRQQHMARTTVGVRNGYAIRRVVSRLGTIFVVDDTSEGFSCFADAEQFAQECPAPGPHTSGDGVAFKTSASQGGTWFRLTRPRLPAQIGPR